MHEVKVFDGLGNLKKVISINSLIKRDKQQIDQPSIFSKSKRFRRMGNKPKKIQEKSTTLKI